VTSSTSHFFTVSKRVKVCVDDTKVDDRFWDGKESATALLFRVETSGFFPYPYRKSKSVRPRYYLFGAARSIISIRFSAAQ
jgi:hypothetical protein